MREFYSIPLWLVCVISLLALPCYKADAAVVTWFPPELRQGEILFVMVKPETEVAHIAGDLGGAPIFFYEQEGGGFAGIVGVDMETPPGLHPLWVNVKDRTGNPSTWVFQVMIQEGGFGVQRLVLPKKMVDLKGKALNCVLNENKRIKEIFLAIRRERLWNNPFGLPVEGPITGEFGLRRIINGNPRSSHNGVDIAALEGTPVRSCNNGIVVLAQELYLGGNTIVIDHGFGLYSIYMHLSEMCVLEGQEVRANDVLGLVGATGRASGPHLHWGMRLMGARIDPFSLLRLFPPKEFEENGWEGF